MATTIDELMAQGCEREKREKVCRTRGGESCAFDGAMIVLQPIADAVHLVHGPSACCGNSWEGRGSLSAQGDLHHRGFTTDLQELDIVYGAEEKLSRAIAAAHEQVKPRAIFVHATCVSGLIGEDIEAVCKKAEAALGIRVIPVNAPGFVGPKNLGNRIAGEVLLDRVIGTGKPPGDAAGYGDRSINLVGEYNIAGDLWLVEPALKRAGIPVLSRMTGNASFEELTYAHHAALNVVVCSRALINIAKEMERRYGIPYLEVSFFGKTEMSKALRAIAARLERLDAERQPSAASRQDGGPGVSERVEAVIREEEERLAQRLEACRHLRGKRAVLYTGGVKSWSFISALLDLGIEIVAVGTKKSTVEDEEKMKELLGEDAPLVEEVTPKNLLKLLKERRADMLIAGGRNQYLAVKEGYPFVDVNQERHTAYAGYEGLLRFAEQISNSMSFYRTLGCAGERANRTEHASCEAPGADRAAAPGIVHHKADLIIDPLKHSPALGAAIAFQGIDRALPLIHGAQGCTFLGKVLLTKHFREPVALATTKLFTEQVVMGSEESLATVTEGFLEKDKPELIGILTSGLSEVKGDDAAGTVKQLCHRRPEAAIVHVPTPDYEGGLEAGYARAVEAMIAGVVKTAAPPSPLSGAPGPGGPYINVIAGSHLTPADFTEIKEIVRSFGLEPLMLPDLSALDGSRQGMSALALGGTAVGTIRDRMSSALFTIALGRSLERAAALLKERCRMDYRVFDSIAGLADTDKLMETLSAISGRTPAERYERERRILVDGMRDAHSCFGSKRIALALEPDLALQTSCWLTGMGASPAQVVVPSGSPSLSTIPAGRVVIGDFSTVEGGIDLLIASSHGERTAQRLRAPLYQLGFPVYKVLGATARTTVGYRGTLLMIYEVANAMMATDK